MRTRSSCRRRRTTAPRWRAAPTTATSAHRCGRAASEVAAAAAAVARRAAAAAIAAAAARAAGAAATARAARAAAATGVEDLRRSHVRGRRPSLGEGRRRLPRGVRRRRVVRGVRGGRRPRGSVRHVGDVHAAQLRAEGGVGGARAPRPVARLLGARRVVRRPHRDHQERSQLPEVDGAVATHPPRHAARAAGRRARRPPLLPPGGRGGGVVLHDRSGPAPRGMHAAELRRLLHGARPRVLLGVARMLLGVCVTRHFNS